jgi:F-type H+-transporting ATPase subunit delta
LDILVDIFAQYEVLRAKALQSLDVEVVSAFPMSSSDEARLSDSLSKRFDKEVSLTSRVDAELIGGAIIRAGDTVIDGSIRGKLDKLAETIRKG